MTFIFVLSSSHIINNFHRRSGVALLYFIGCLLNDSSFYLVSSNNKNPYSRFQYLFIFQTAPEKLMSCEKQSAMIIQLTSLQFNIFRFCILKYYSLSLLKKFNESLAENQYKMRLQMTEEHDFGHKAYEYNKKISDCFCKRMTDGQNKIKESNLW